MKFDINDQYETKPAFFSVNNVALLIIAFLISINSQLPPTLKALLFLSIYGFGVIMWHLKYIIALLEKKDLRP